MLFLSPWESNYSVLTNNRSFCSARSSCPSRPQSTFKLDMNLRSPRHLPWLTWVPERSCWQSASEFRLQTSALAYASQDAQCHTQQLMPRPHSLICAAYSLNATSRHSPNRLLSFVCSLIRLRAGPSTSLRRHSPTMRLLTASNLLSKFQHALVSPSLVRAGEPAWPG
jgi:hypothetical protein